MLELKFRTEGFYFCVRYATIGLFLIIGVQSQESEVTPSDDIDLNRPLMSHASFYNITPYMEQRQPLSFRIGESLLPEDIEGVLNLHNELRTGVSPQSSDMEYMSWDQDLAYMAQQWADRCRFEHGNPPNTSPYTQIGQNIWAYTGSRDSPRSAEAATQSWYDEVVDYDYNNNRCNYGKVCGHYTQVVWATSNKIGCGRAFCPYISYLQNAWYVVCNYAPAGNYQGQHPYHVGEPCNQCGSGRGECYDGLCRLCSDHDEACRCAQKCQNCGRLNTAECSCDCEDGWWGADCSRPCVDTHPWCNANPGWPDENACPWAPEIPLECPLMCGICKGGNPTATCDPNQGDGSDSLCTSAFTSYGFINGKLFLFKGSKIWRFNNNGDLKSERGGEKSKKYFKKLPKAPAAVFERADGNVGFVKGSKFYLYSGKTLVESYPVTLTAMGLSNNMKAAFHKPDQGKAGKTYFMKGNNVWRYDEAKQRLDNGYPKVITEMFPGLRSDPTGAFINNAGVVHVIYGKKYLTIAADNSVSTKFKKFAANFIPGC